MDTNGDVQGFMLFGTRIPKEAAGPAVKGEEGVKTKEDEAEKGASAAALPCPRCKSTETKFCYFNNYNVNQPRHFCKGCQRYWTAGGTLRNVPIGAGRRKARPSSREGCCVLDYSPGLMEDTSAVEQWLLNRDLPTKRPNNGLASRIR
ncbi:hypothetical protein Taro_013143 [Colocasia esculenta]|uniref:Dof-type domain-containing protein n=1 Tax=Colocasia esculenta TaxID=4460 RepID=A0A843UB27_COLES|nr:hypothetical protein [Colocasia esculenta]